MGTITEVDRYLFGKGTHYEIYKKLGAHIIEIGGKVGVNFSLWAPNAESVSLVGDFNNWDIDANQMMEIKDSGIYELFIPNLGEGALYKFAIKSKDKAIHFKADPYAKHCEFRPNTASIVVNIEGYSWSDQDWRNRSLKETEPMAIYEVHLGSFIKNENLERAGYYNYKELAHLLADYVKKMGYTHIELIGIAEHPYDGSWGYQVTGYYAPTSRYGMPRDFMHFIDYMHQNNIGVILDWVPAHFPKDDHGLALFDGTCLYEYRNPKMNEHSHWGTKIFDYSKSEVTNFLIANALYWLEEYHIDGLRVDAVASMLYLDYNKAEGEWIPNKYGGNQNLEAIEFFRHLNSIVKERVPKAMVIAEESTAWPKVTGDIKDGSLGFTHKWNMGWMNDFLEYLKQDPLFRKYHHNRMTFTMTYAYSENFILVLSHDEVVHLKKSMLEKIPGDYRDKFNTLKAAYGFMFGHPGKKLLFMGQDFGQRREWSEDRSLDWFLLEDDSHRNLQIYVQQLLHIYTSYPSMYELDRNWDGFEWINCDDADRSIFSFIRKSKSGIKDLLFICNFTPVERKDYKVGVPSMGSYQVILDSTKVGDGYESNKIPVYKAMKEEWDKKPYSIEFSLPPLSTLIIEFNQKKK